MIAPLTLSLNDARSELSFGKISRSENHTLIFNLDIDHNQFWGFPTKNEKKQKIKTVSSLFEGRRYDTGIGRESWDPSGI